MHLNSIMDCDAVMNHHCALQQQPRLLLKP
jgi:hypothetical protein